MFQALHEALVKAQPDIGTIRSILQASTSDANRSLESLEGIYVRGQHEKFEMVEEQWQLFALSQVLDLLITEMCTPRREIVAAPLEAYCEFMHDLNMEKVDDRDTFSAFHHEIVEVVPDEKIIEPVVEETLWPGYRREELLITRAGVRIRAASKHVDKTTAETSTQFFTQSRSYRLTHHLSDGWGGNSRWRTCFPLFYDCEDGVHFNDLGKQDISEGADIPDLAVDVFADLPLRRRRELLKHRCFVTTPLPDEDLCFPYDTRLTLPG